MDRGDRAMSLARLEEQYLAMSFNDEVDVICDEFESELAAGRLPDIDAYVRRGGPGRRSQLFSELSAINFEYRNWFVREYNLAGPAVDLSADTAAPHETLNE